MDDGENACAVGMPLPDMFVAAQRGCAGEARRLAADTRPRP